jgi:hypothetical protein
VQVTDIADDVRVTGVTVAPKTASIAPGATRKQTPVKLQYPGHLPMPPKQRLAIPAW